MSPLGLLATIKCSIRFFQRLVDRKVCNESYDTVSVGFFSRYDIISVLVRGKNYMFNSYF